ncbi:hypothetical protein T265_09347 [Opisthorchis viverrini]|uniref:Uncharacterized protein n=1 Tax=Opisthorchis viverrini TaxID=6198 RepID=A0A074Z615_OPIVI|nr:hypothetical protein T265_09347 [Opisthorchis viverrini]KER22586.1 hypothetical protein T265_09347 [Opisthorchis viverrini]
MKNLTNNFRKVEPSRPPKLDSEDPDVVFRNTGGYSAVQKPMEGGYFEISRSNNTFETIQTESDNHYADRSYH